MRLVIARCAVDYDGRLSAHLPMAVRLLMVKADGCVAVHADSGAYKPMNWMTAPNTLVVEADRWVVTNPKGERLTITIDEVLHDVSEELGDAPALVKDGVEAHLQELLAADCSVFGIGCTLIRREYPTDIGPVDLLCRDGEGRMVAIEVKRRGEIDGVEQLARYLERLVLDSRNANVRGLFVAQSITPQAKVMCEARGMRWLEVDYDVLRGAKEPELTLF
jgi:RecB family endonuclease NucS